jgi:hypothetical protein
MRVRRMTVSGSGGKREGKEEEVLGYFYVSEEQPCVTVSMALVIMSSWVHF